MKQLLPDILQGCFLKMSARKILPRSLGNDLVPLTNGLGRNLYANIILFLYASNSSSSASRAPASFVPTPLLSVDGLFLFKQRDQMD